MQQTFISPHQRLYLACGIVVAGAVAAAAVPMPLEARAVVVCAVPLALWLLELTAPFVPTLVLLALAPMVLPMPEAAVAGLLESAANPVLLLFFSGFCLGQAIHKNGLDHRLTAWAIGWSRGDAARLLFATMLASAFLSMWISNTAAAALVYAAMAGILLHASQQQRARLVVGVAVAANLGGMLTPLGTAPNAFALAEALPFMRITFAHWMGLTIPLGLGLLVLGYMTLRPPANVPAAAMPVLSDAPRASRAMLVITAITVAMWLLEPLHGLPAPLVGAACCAAMFVLGVLTREDLAAVDWSTLILVAGGLMVGSILEHSGAAHAAISASRIDAMPPLLRDVCLVFGAATLSALMSNTATAALLIPLAIELAPSASSAVLVAVAASLGMPFVISTPPNAMAAAHGATSRDIMRAGIPIMVVGGLVVALTGRTVLRFLGVP